jgi:hypothetical protein
MSDSLSERNFSFLLSRTLANHMLITYLLFVAPEIHLRQMSSDVGGDGE